MSAKFNNMLMTGGAFNFAEGDINFNGSGESVTDRGVDRLFSNVAPGAFHDSGERFDAPKCHTNTRVAVIQEIIDWLDDLESSELVMWLHGAAGAGKSAIAQTIAQILFEQGRLSGSFFFARGSTTGRGDAKRLVSTLAYQLAKYRPDTRAHIAKAVISDPAIFDLTLFSQVQNLLINPLRIASSSNAASSSSKTSSRLFIIDGLDECHDADAQCRILQVFATAMKSMQSHPSHKLLIASRSEMHLLAGFNELNTAAVCRRLPLDNSYRPNDDIRLYLQDSFSKIKGEHRMRAYLEHSWPSTETISSLVRKSSGQFIYASTVVKFVASPRHHPADRLKIILGLKTAGRNDLPFAALDSLYSHIFQSVEDIELVICIMQIALYDYVGIPGPVHKGDECQILFGISAEELELILGDLISVIRLDRETGWFTFLHASIPDFLLDPHRSRTFYIDQPKVNLYRAECCVKVICDIYSNKPHASAPAYIAWAHLSDCTGRLVDPADKELLYQSLSSLDMRRALDHHFIHLRRSPGISFKPIGQLLLWSLQEHQKYPEKATVLSKLNHQFDVWFLSHLQTVSINGFDNEFGIDLMVFAMTHFGDGDGTLIEHRLNILDVLEYSAPMPSAELVTALATPSAPDGAKLLFPWYFGVYAEHCIEYFTLLRHFFHDPERAGKYFMSGVRYANAALHCVNFLFDTRQAIRRIRDETRWVLERETLYLAMEYTVVFLGKATATKDLFELLLGPVTPSKGSSSGTSSVLPAIETNARYRLNSRIDMLFATGPSTSHQDSLGVQSVNGMFYRITVSEDKSVAQWQEESVRRVVMAMSEYVSTTCRAFLLDS